VAREDLAPSAPGAPLPVGSDGAVTGLQDVLDRVRDGTEVRAARAGGPGAAEQDALSRISELAAQLSQEPARLGPLDE
jgi:antitoxin (DNA-binding transcriptional repressor) of toxin-antitoxin stability system